MYYNKYLKYKKKYLQLKNQIGGKEFCEKVYNNAIGTCWAVDIQLIMTSGEATSRQFDTIMRSFKPWSITWYNPFRDISVSKKEFIANQIKKVQANTKLNKIFPDYIFNFPNILYLMTILDKFIDRYYSKILEFNYTEKPIGTINKENQLRCELVIAQNFKNLFPQPLNLNNTGYGSYIFDQYLFSNLLSVFFLGYEVSFTNYYDNFNLIDFDSNNKLGILLIIENHMCCLYICNGEETYYNDNDKKSYKC